MLLLMPGLAVIGLVPVMAGHVCYYARAFLVPNAPETTGQGEVWQLGILLAVTLLLALLCDWQLGKRGPGKPLPTERVLAMLPYLPLLVPLSSVMAGNAPPVNLAAVLGGIAVASLMTARVAILRRRQPERIPAVPAHGLPGLWTLGYACALASVCVCVYGILFTTKAAFSYGGYLPAFWGYLVSLILFERLAARPNGRAAWTCRLLCAGIVLLAVAGLYPWNRGRSLRGARRARPDVCGNGYAFGSVSTILRHCCFSWPRGVESPVVDGHGVRRPGRISREYAGYANTGRL